MFQDIVSAFYSTCERYSENIAIIYLGNRWKYKELFNLVERFSSSLLKIGLSKGDRVLIYLPNSPQWIISWFSILKLGAIAVPISPIYTPSDIQYIANDCEAEVAICLDTNFRYIYQIMGNTRINKVIITNIADLLPFWKRVIGVAFDRIPKGRIAKEKGI